MIDPPPIIGEDPAFLEIQEQISRLATVDRPCLVVGERGTGKELLTTRLHYLSPRWDGPLIKINCAALTESLLETELFGHEAGAFTGARQQYVGRFERANHGTLVLDEITNASAAVQTRRLRKMNRGVVRNICATRNRNKREQPGRTGIWRDTISGSAPGCGGQRGQSGWGGKSELAGYSQAF